VPATRDAADPPPIRLRGVRFHYPPSDRGAEPFALAVDDFTLAARECVACIGPSGSGKTTFLHLCCGVLVPATGSAELAGHDITAWSDARRRAHRVRHVGMVFQQFELLEYLSTLDNILLPMHVGDLRDERALRDRARDLADRLGIAHGLRRKPQHLSQGERQRVAICRALVTAPGVVLCDEPTGNLDPDTAQRILDELFEQTARSGAAMIMVTHDHGLLGRFDRTIDVRELQGRDPSTPERARR